MEVGLLDKLSPAETYCFINGEKANYRRVLQLILMDFHLQKLLYLRPQNRRGEGRASAPLVLYVSLNQQKLDRNIIGKGFQEMFLKPFKNDLEIEYLLPQYLKAILGKIGAASSFIQRNLTETEILRQQYRTRGLMQWLGAPMKLSEEGKEEKAKTVELIERLEYQLPSLLKHDLAKAKELLCKIGGNVLLLRIGKSLFQELGEPFSGYKDVSKAGTTSAYTIDEDYLLCFDDRFIEAYESDFKRAFIPPNSKRAGVDGDGYGSSNDSNGCGSGCGGCGGCGD